MTFNIVVIQVCCFLTFWLPWFKHLSNLQTVTQKKSVCNTSNISEGIPLAGICPFERESQRIPLFFSMLMLHGPCNSCYGLRYVVLKLMGMSPSLYNKHCPVAYAFITSFFIMTRGEQIHFKPQLVNNCKWTPVKTDCSKRGQRLMYLREIEFC